MNISLLSQMDYDNDCLRHCRTRAVGQIYMGPLSQKGYDNRVLQLTATELEFQNSIEAGRFLQCKRNQLANSKELSRMRKLKHVDND